MKLLLDKTTACQIVLSWPPHVGRAMPKGPLVLRQDDRSIIIYISGPPPRFLNN